MPAEIERVHFPLGLHERRGVPDSSQVLRIEGRGLWQRILPRRSESVWGAPATARKAIVAASATIEPTRQFRILLFLESSNVREQFKYAKIRITIARAKTMLA